MIRKLLMAIAVMATLSAGAEIRFVENSFRATNAADVATGGTELGEKNMTSALTDYPDDFDGNAPTALVRVKFKNFANVDVNGKMSVDSPTGHVLKSEYRTVNGDIELWVFMDSGRDHSLQLTQTDGMGAVLIEGLTVKPETMYTLTVENADEASISLYTIPAGAQITIDNQPVGTTPTGAPLIVQHVQFGRHSVLANKAGYPVKREEIDVSKINNTFTIDLRPYHTVVFTTNEDKATLSIDNGRTERFTNRTFTTQLPEGAHRIVVTSGIHGKVLEYPVSVSATNNAFTLPLYETRVVNFTAMQNNKPVNANMEVDGTARGVTPQNLELPYGQHSVLMTYGNVSRNETFRVDANHNQVQVILPKSVRRWNPFEIDFRNRAWGLSFAYISKWYSMSDSHGSKKVNQWGSEDGKSLKGGQIGIAAQPVFGYGLGLYSGLYFDMYFGDSPDDRYKHYQELALELPVHLMFRLPLGDAGTTSVMLHGGATFEYGLSAKMETSSSGENTSYDHIKLKFGDPGMPKAFNPYIEFGAKFQFKALQIGASYSLGMSNNKTMLEDNPDLALQLPAEGATIKPRRLAIQLQLMF